MKNLLKKLCCVLLSLTLLPSTVAPAFAQSPGPGSQTDVAALAGQNGDEWEARFPYGTFAFSTAEVSAEEGGAEQRVTVHRLGGAAGRAIAYIQLAPVLAQISEDETSYLNAAGKSDYALSAEDPLPIAAYQPIGRESDPLASGEAVYIREAGITEPAYTTEGGIESYGDVTVYTDADADSYQWLVYSAESGEWEEIDGANGRELLVPADQIDAYDFRCVYVKNGKKYSTNGLSGFVYAPQAEESLPPVPADLDLNPEKSFSKVLMEEGEYDSYVFALVFAEGESEKELLFLAAPDGDTEADEFATATIIDCDGGSVYDTANRLIFRIAANGEAGASYISFAQTEYIFDKAQQTGRLTLRREGDLLSFLTVGYETVDGTAVSGIDYAGTDSGIATFPTGIAEVPLEIALIDDGVYNPEADRQFSVVLTEIKGGGEGSATGGAASVSLYNSGETLDSVNYATMLYTGEATDVSAGAPDQSSVIAPSFSQPQAKMVAEEASAPVEGRVSFAGSEGITLLTHEYGNISFSRGDNYLNNYWGNWQWLSKANNAGASVETNDVVGYASPSNFSSYWSKSGNISVGEDGTSGALIVKSERAGDAYFRADLGEMFSNFYYEGTLKSGKNGDNITGSWGRPYLRLLKQDNGTLYTETGPSPGSGVRNIAGTWSVPESAGSIRAQIDHWHGKDAGAYVRLQAARFERRILDNDLSLVIHTADDGKISALRENAAFYNAVKPSVTLAPKKSGVSANGRLYAGSELTVVPAATATYEFAQSSALSIRNAVFLSRDSDGSEMNLASSIDANGEASLKIQTQAAETRLQLDGRYSVNAVLDRVQDVNIHLAPSMPRKTNPDGTAGVEVDGDRFEETAADFYGKISAGNGSAKIQFTYKQAQAAAKNAEDPYFVPLSMELGEADLLKDTEKHLLSRQGIRNLQSVNFGLPADHLIVFDGVSYPGDADIEIPVGSFSSKSLDFLYYTPEYVTAVNSMVASVSHFERYVDANHNGRLDGWYDASIGFFRLFDSAGRENGDAGFDASSADALIDIIQKSDYRITDFEPYFANGAYAQQFLKTHYTLTPRSLVPPAGSGAADLVQILPTFTTNVTNKTVKSRLTDELQGYRFITSGQHAKTHYIIRNGNDWESVQGEPPAGAGAAVVKRAGEYSGDGKTMYTAAANIRETVDSPLGGNTNTLSFAWDGVNGAPKLNADGDYYYDPADWDPKYIDNLLYPFTNPAPIFINDTPLGEFVPVADVVSADAVTGVKQYDVKQLNAYLGSYNANDTLLLSVREQEETTEKILEAKTAFHALGAGGYTPLAESVALDGEVIELDTVNLTGTGTVPGTDSLNMMKSMDSDENTQSGWNTADSANTIKAMETDAGIELPSLNFGLSDYVTVIMDGYEVGFSIGLPLFEASRSQKPHSASSSNDAKAFTNEVNGPRGANGWNKAGMTKLKDYLKNPKKALMKDEEWADITKAATDAKNANPADGNKDKFMNSAAFKVSVSANVTILFKYNTLDNKYEFSSALVTVSASLSYKATVRFVAVPIFYGYIMVGLSVNAAGGVIVDRVVKTKGTAINFPADYALKTEGWTADGSDSLAYGGEWLVGEENAGLDVAVASDAFQITFRGKLGILNESGFGGFSGGFVTSDGEEPVVVKLNSKITGSGNGVVRLISMEDGTAIDKIELIEKIQNDTYFSGLTVNPDLFVEVGAGIGIEILKVEIFFKIDVSVMMTFASRQQDGATGEYKTEAFSFDYFKFRAGLGLRIVLLVFSFELDIFQIGIDYRKEYNKSLAGEFAEGSPSGYNNSGWKFAWYVGNGAKEGSLSSPLNSFAQSLPEPWTTPAALAPLSGQGMPETWTTPGALTDPSASLPAPADDFQPANGFPGMKIYVPANSYSAQKIFGAEEGNRIMAEIEETSEDGGITPFAYDPYADAPFQISGYSSNGSAFKLAEGLVTGTDYELVEAGGVNYLLYTVSRSPSDYSNPVDSNMLVMSRVVNTGESVGLYEPNTDVPGYIVVDPEAEATGDLDFSAVSDGDAIYVTWVSYKSKSAAAPPDKPVQEQLAEAARNTEVKTAVYEIASPSAFTLADGFLDPMDTDGLRFLPKVTRSGGVVLYAASAPMTEAQKAAADRRYQAQYDAATTGAAVTDLGNGYTSATAGDPTAGASLAISQSMDDVYGQSTVFHFLVKDAAGAYRHYAAAPDGWADAGMRLESMAVTEMSGDALYLAYIARKTAVTQEGTEANVRFLYLQKATVNQTDGSISLGTAAVVRKLYDAGSGANAGDFGLTALTASAEDTKYAGMDGVYSGVRQTSAYEDPYISNLKFLNGKLGALTGTEEEFDESQTFTSMAMPVAETFLLFEMNGNSFVVPQSSLESITADDASARKGVVIPFFDDTEQNGSRGNMTVGADAAGNISAVFTDTVENTTNNAVYVMKYDPGDGEDVLPSWGSGRMLAMNYMQVYEDAAANAWSPAKTEAAYTDPEKGGGMTSFVFSNIAVAAGYKSVTPEDAEDPPADAPGSLFFLAQGTQTELTRVAFADPEDGDAGEIIVPKTDADGRTKSSNGYYAISFGVGEQAIGEGSIHFYEDDFTPGASLRPVLSFKNVGDAQIRGSEANPISLALKIKSPANEIYTLATWKIEESIPVGARINTYSERADQFTEALPAGSGEEGLKGWTFYFTVSEDGDYAADPFTYDSSASPGGTKVVVSDLPELAVEGMELAVGGVDGDSVILAASMKATNRGAADAQGVYLQFSAQKGVDENGDAVFEPMDLTGHKLAIGAQKPLAELAALSASSSQELARGILRLHGTDGTDDLKAGYGRLVTGTFSVPKSSFSDENIAGSLSVAVEILYADPLGGTELEANGLIRSDHAGELNAANNVAYQDIAAHTFFSAPAKIAVPVGASARIYVPAQTTRLASPVALCEELSLTLGEPETKHLGALYYNQEGHYIAVTPGEEGEGVIRLSDPATGSFLDIAFVATEPGEGINIFNDNAIFSFYDTAGELHTGDTTGAHKNDWVFYGNQMAWGAGDAVPYRNDIATAKRGAKFTFPTMADAVNLHFAGTALIESDYPGFDGKEINGADAAGVTVSFNNPNNRPHVVTVTVLSEQAHFDIYIEDFGGNEPPVPADDPNAPHIYWNRNLPAPGSVKKGETVTLTATVIDDYGIASVALDGVNIREPGAAANVRELSGRVWKFDVAVNSNGSFKVSAVDTAANRTDRNVAADWFKTADGDGTDQEIFLGASLVDAAGNPLPENGSQVAENIFIAYAPPENGQTVSLERWDNGKPGFVDDGAVSEGDAFEISKNDIYRVIKRDADGIAFASEIFFVDRFDRTRPTVEILESTSDVLRIRVYKEASADAEVQDGFEKLSPVTEVTLNGYPVAIPAGRTEFTLSPPVRFNGVYVILAKDGNGLVSSEVSGRVTSMPVKFGEGAVTSEKSWNQAQDSGTIRVNAAQLSGGYFDTAAQSAGNVYQGEYRFAAAPAGSPLGSAEVLAAAKAPQGGQAVFTGLAPGEYIVYAADDLAGEAGADPGIGSIHVSVGDEAIKHSVYTSYSRSDMPTGHIELTALGGGSGEYLFAIIPAAEDADGETARQFDHSALEHAVYHDETVMVSIPNPAYVRDEEGEYPDGVPAFLQEERTVATPDRYLGVWRKPENAVTWDKSLMFSNMAVGKYITVVRAADEQYYRERPASTSLSLAEMPYEWTLDRTAPLIEILGRDEDGSLLFRIYKEDPEVITSEEDYETAPITEVTVNGYPLAIPGGKTDISLSFPLHLDGSYAINAKDINGTPAVETVKTVTDFPLKLDPEAVVSENSQNIARNNGTVTISESGLSGGYFDPETQAAGNVYVPKYRFMLLPSGKTPDEAAVAAAKGFGEDGTLLLDGVSPGLYDLYAITVKSGMDFEFDRLEILIGDDGPVDGNGVMMSEIAKNAVPEVSQPLAAVTFSDIAGHWAEQDILFVAERGLLVGTGGGRFEPDANVSRAMFVTVLWRTEGSPSAADAGAFTDVPAGAWYAEAVAWANARGIVRGYGEGRFAPDESISREQMCAILSRYMDDAGWDGSEYLSAGAGQTPFADAAKISEYAREAVAKIRGAGIVNGMGNNLFAPRDFSTRAQAAAVIRRLIEFRSNAE
ncbi:MAG: S-layer homology domain-containing protein [Clostridiales Family XIII bacterium]|jgi:hypothetical protein|nr:S-layer homology domain-containing protein [Clostridiales Family XIII bacterium]